MTKYLVMSDFKQSLSATAVTIGSVLGETAMDSSGDCAQHHTRYGNSAGTVSYRDLRDRCVSPDTHTNENYVT